MLTKLKKRIQQLLSSQAKAAHTIGLTPNSISIIGFILAFLAATAYAITTPENTFWIAVAVILLMASGFCDTLDGILARTYQQATAFGGFFDSLLDRYADVLVLSGIIIAGLCNLVAGLAAISSSLMVSYSRARAEAAGVKMESIGIAERPERIIILAGASIAAYFWFPALNIGIILIAVLATFTVLQRGLHAFKELKGREPKPPT